MPWSARSLLLGLLIAVNGCSCEGDRLGSCNANTVRCGEECSDLLSDPENCGECANACASGEVCVGGACALTCPAGQSACNRGSTLFCADLYSDENACGSCDTACTSMETCTAGVCVPICTGGESPCGQSCTDLQTDPLNCGACGVACPQAQICIDASCVCESDETLCGSSCTDISTDTQNCGACGNVCPPDQTCTSSACVCPSGETECDGGCTNTSTDPNNCAFCGITCLSQVCVDGACAPVNGCSDGTREGFVDQAQFPNIAGCSGGWSVAGMEAPVSCNRMSGNSSPINPTGNGCAAADLCSGGFHICTSSNDIVRNLPQGQQCSSATTVPSMFFVTQETGPGCGVCSGYDDQVCDPSLCDCNGGCTNDLFGCGTMGDGPNSDCGVLNVFSNDLCGALPVGGWSCGSDGCSEFVNVTKTTAEGGGVLCCADAPVGSIDAGTIDGG